MLKFIPLLLLTLSAFVAKAQNIYTAWHLNENTDYKYGKPLVIVETNTFYAGDEKKIDKNLKTFDNAGMLLKEERFDEKGQLEARLTYVNDTLKHIILKRVIERWTNRNNTRATAVYTYDNNNFLTRITDVDDFGNPMWVYEYVNNDKGDPVEMYTYNGNGSSYGVEKADYYYDKDTAITAVYSKDGRKLSTSTLKLNHKKTDTVTGKSNYNEHGDVLSYRSVNFMGVETLYEIDYLYDSVGNCIDEMTYEVTVKRNGKKKRTPSMRFQKQITYL